MHSIAILPFLIPKYLAKSRVAPRSDYGLVMLRSRPLEHPPVMAAILLVITGILTGCFAHSTRPTDSTTTQKDPLSSPPSFFPFRTLCVLLFSPFPSLILPLLSSLILSLPVPTSLPSSLSYSTLLNLLFSREPPSRAPHPTRSRASARTTRNHTLSTREADPKPPRVGPGKARL